MMVRLSMVILGLFIALTLVGCQSVTAPRGEHNEGYEATDTDEETNGGDVSHEWWGQGDGSFNRQSTYR